MRSRSERNREVRKKRKGLILVFLFFLVGVGSYIIYDFTSDTKDNVTLQTKFKFEDNKFTGAEYKVIPTMITSVENRNDFVPTPAKDKNRENILTELNKLSPTLNGRISDEFWDIK